MKDSKGNEIGLKRLDLLTDEDLDTLKGDAFDDWNWETGNPFARLVYDFCVIEEDKRIRTRIEKEGKAKRNLKECEAKLAWYKAEAEMKKEINEATKEMITGAIKDTTKKAKRVFSTRGFAILERKRASMAEKHKNPHISVNAKTIHAHQKSPRRSNT